MMAAAPAAPPAASGGPTAAAKSLGFLQQPPGLPGFMKPQAVKGWRHASTLHVPHQSAAAASVHPILLSLSTILARLNHMRPEEQGERIYRN